MQTLENKTLTRENAGQIAASARQWVASREGQQAVATGLKQAQEASAEFNKAQRIDPEILHKPITL